MISELLTSLYASSLEITVLDVLLRLLCALIVGVVIGTEREYTHRPAGMRTHMLVSLGASVVMVIGQIVFVQYRQHGAAPDPARMAAQVITGVGFLGAGTIMKEGPTVKGLTTAASLWATACLGLAAGAGYYTVALAGMVFIFITLTIFEIIQRKLIGTRYVSEDYRIVTANISACLETMNQTAGSTGATICDIQAQHDVSGTYTIRFRADFAGSKTTEHKQALFEALMSADGSITVSTSGEFAHSI